MTIRSLPREGAQRSTWLNDVHSRLSPTRVAEVLPVASLEEVRAALRRARSEGRGVSIAGGRYAMGAQPFGTDTLHLDTRRMSRVLGVDEQRGILHVEAGILWPDLVAATHTMASPHALGWGIAQKQTGADRLSLGGAVSANAHGRGLDMGPLIGDVEALDLVDADGRLQRCSREENAELFRLAVGGYGLFGFVHSVHLRLRPRRKLRRVVELGRVESVLPALEARAAAGDLYGDFQFAVDRDSPAFLRDGIFSCYRPLDDETPIPAGQRALTSTDWKDLLYLAHADPTRAFERYSRHYLSTSGNVYWSDTHQLGVYVTDYHEELDQRLGSSTPSTEVITELYVPRERLVDFFDEVREDFRRNRTELIYGTLRLIQPDRESFLAWAKRDYACVIFNLCTEHSAAGERRSADAFRLLIDRAVARGGSYYLTYHRHATRSQLLAAYPQFPAFLEAKRRHDPDQLFQSDWYRHHVELLGSADAAS